MTDILEQLSAKLSGASTEERLRFDRLLGQEAKEPWSTDPRNKPQVEAFHSQADLLLYGGAAGGGKSDLLIGVATTQHEKAVIFRQQYVDLRGIEERIVEIYPRKAWNGGDYILTLPGHRLELGALAKPGAEFGWQGRPHDFIGIDEAAQVNETKVRFVLGWLRSVKPGQRKRAILASNPPIGGEGDWLIEWFAPWLDPLFPDPAKPGELRWAIVSAKGQTVWVDGPGDYLIEGEERPVVALSRTFIPALLKDNPYLAGTGYEAQLDALPEPMRTQLKTGDFLAGREDHEMQVIPSEWVDAAMARHARGKPLGMAMSAIGVDVAVSIATTVLARLWGVWFDDLLRYPGKKTPDGPTLAGLIVAARRGQAEIAIDMTGGWGMSARDHLTKMDIPVTGVVFSSGSPLKDKSSKLEFANKRAELYWLFREALDPNSGDDIALPQDRVLKAQLTAARWHPRGNKIVIEDKDEIAGRLGSSPDDADAVVMAWSRRRFFVQAQEAKKGKTHESVEPDDPLKDW